MDGVPKEKRIEFEWTLFIGTFGFVLIALPALYMSISSAREKKQIIEYQTYETAQIIKIETIRKGRTSTPFIRFHYQYSFENKVFNKYQDYGYQRYFVNFTPDKWHLVEGRQFPVILSSEDPSKHRILMFWSDFSKFSLPFPDSLKWSERVFYDKLPYSYPDV
jgi:ABC-type glycerol-3-phosphate transport system permease component